VTAGDPGVPEAPNPDARLRETLLGQAARLEADAGDDAARELLAAVAQWWEERDAWNARLAGALRIHHDINNALVGVRGNAQLILMGPAAAVPGVKDRLEVVLRESRRIQEAAGQLRELKVALLEGRDGPARAA
jgi:signal transduction histidine kinase